MSKQIQGRFGSRHHEAYLHPRWRGDLLALRSSLSEAIRSLAPSDCEVLRLRFLFLPMRTLALSAIHAAHNCEVLTGRVTGLDLIGRGFAAAAFRFTLFQVRLYQYSTNVNYNVQL